jgi:N-acetylglucosaminyldiphosphoundecaprenol N-acetyl-beta-D-mannosaminyltransferase
MDFDMTTDTSPAQPEAHLCERRTEGPHVNGVRIDPVSRPGFLHAVEDFIGCGQATGNAHVIHFCAAHPTVEARRDAEYRALLNRGDLNVADGMPVAWAARRDGRPTLRLAGTDGMGELCAWGETRDLAHYLYGATDETLVAMRANLERTYPEIRIVGVESPPFRAITDEELDETAARIRAAGADAVWIGLGAPKQDVMAARLRERTPAPLLFAVGAAFDFLAGTKSRAPEWMRRSGLEWAHRLGSEPGRLWKRYLVGNAEFVAGVASDRIRGRR